MIGLLGLHVVVRTPAPQLEAVGRKRRGIYSMNNHLNRIYHFKGNPHEIGFTAGRMLGAKLEQTLSHYIASREHASDMNKLHQGALPWLRSLPKRFQDEFEGMAEGAKLPLQSLAE